MSYVLFLIIVWFGCFIFYYICFQNKTQIFTFLAFSFYFFCYSIFILSYNWLRGLVQIKKAGILLFFGVGLGPLIFVSIISILKSELLFIVLGLNLLISCIPIFWKIPFFKINKKRFLKNVKVLQLFKNGFQRGFANLMYQAIFFAGPFLMGIHGCFKEAGYFTIAQNFPKILESLTEGFYRSGVPLLYNYKEHQNKILPQTKIKLSIITSFAFGIISMIFILLNTKNLVYLLFGKEFWEAIHYVEVIALSFPFFLLYSTNKTFLDASEKTNLSFLCLMNSFFSFLLFFFCSKNFFSLTNVVLVSFVIAIIVLGVTSYYHITKEHEILISKKEVWFFIFFYLLGLIIYIKKITSRLF